MAQNRNKKQKRIGNRTQIKEDQVACICTCILMRNTLPSVLWRCWLGGRKGIRPVKNEWWGVGVVVCLERGAGLHMAQLMPMPLTVSCSSKIQIGFTFLVPAYPGCPGKEAVKWLCGYLCAISYSRFSFILPLEICDPDFGYFLVTLLTLSLLSFTWQELSLADEHFSACGLDVWGSLPVKSYQLACLILGSTL